MSNIHQIIRPQARLRQHRMEIWLLVVAWIIPLTVWLAWHNGGFLARSGSLMVFFSTLAEFVVLNKSNRKHLDNAVRVQIGEIPWTSSKIDTFVNYAALMSALFGVAIWGYGDWLR